MQPPDDNVQVYQELSEFYARRGEAPMRDRFLILAADAALRRGLVEEAERLRARLLYRNPHHLLKPYDSFAQAVQAPDVQMYLRDLRLNYPPEVAQTLLRSLSHTEGEAAGGAANDQTEPLKLRPPREPPAAPETVVLPAQAGERDRRPAVAEPQERTPVPVPRAPGLPADTSARPQRRFRQDRAAPEPLAPPAAPPPQPADAALGGWFAMGLSALVLAAGAALAAFTLLRPFLTGG